MCGTKIPLIMKNLNIIKIALIAIIIFLGYMVYESIMKPIRFNKARSVRETAVIQRLKEIRTAQLAYKSVNTRYASTFDSLIMFIKGGKFPLILKIGNPDDSTAKIIRDTVYVDVIDSLFKGNIAKVDSLPFVPYGNGAKFEFAAGIVDKGNVKVGVFEIKSNKKIYLDGLNEDYINNDKIKDLTVGSMSEPITDGNWE